MSDPTELTLFECTQGRCSAKFWTYEGLVYHTAGAHDNLFDTMSLRAVKCPVCEDTFLLIHGSFCRDHYMFVHQQATKAVPYTTWLQNASKQFVPTPEQVKRLTKGGKASVPKAARASAEAETPVRKKPKSKTPVTKRRKPDQNLQPTEQGEVDVLPEDEDEDEDGEEIDRKQVENAKQLLDGHEIVGGLEGPVLYLDLDYDLAEKYLRLGLPYKAVDAVLKELVASAPHT
jgi:hypothetical protein